ncbi:MAG: hypothetical protein HYS13_22040 [Planctomycetia bacterium]|nr:hypothetical protein [Planctomycetia bacterium]
MPTYGIAEAARYLQLPLATLRSWVVGRTYQAGGEHRRFKPLIALPDPKSGLLSFYNLAEAHVLSAFRRKHHVPLSRIRAALRFVRQRFGWRRPLIEQEFRTDGATLFIEHLGQLIDAAGGQLVMKSVLDAHLERLQWRDRSLVCFYPFTRPVADPAEIAAAPKSVLIDPRFAFGRPVLARGKVATAVLADRFKAGESLVDLASDYGCEASEIEEGIRCELQAA